MSTLHVVGLALPLVAGCIGNVQRSARVPHAAVPLNSGQPLTAPAEVSAGLSNVTDVLKPRVGDASQAVEIPATQMRNEIRLRLRDRAQLGLIIVNQNLIAAPVQYGPGIGVALNARLGL